MAFNKTAFLKQEFKQRIEEVKVPSLASFFEGEPLWRIRGQTGEELARMLDLETTQQSLSQIVEALGNSQEVTAELREVLGTGTNVPFDLVKRINQLVVCSLTPEIDQHTAVKFAECYPIEFYLLTNKITALTGLGMEIAVKKPDPSGNIQA